MKQAFLSFSLACAALAVQAAPTLPPMATIPAGSFSMGSLEPVIGDGSHNPRESPPHTVQVKSFRMARFETTVAQFREFVAATGYRTEDQCWVFARGDRIKLARKDEEHGQNDAHHHFVQLSAVASCDGGKVWLSADAANAEQLMEEEDGSSVRPGEKNQQR